METLEDKYGVAPERETGALPAAYLGEAATYWALLMPAILDITKKDEKAGLQRLVLRGVLPSELIEEAADEADERDSLISQIRAYDPSLVRDKAAREAMEERFSYSYP